MLTRIAMSPAVDPEPVTLAEFCEHLRYPSDVETEWASLQMYVSIARQEVENYLSRALITSRWEQRFADWPSEYIELECGNLQQVLSVTYTDSSGVTATWASSEYRVSRIYVSGENDARKGTIRPIFGHTWPSVTLDVGEPICVQFDAGWLDAASVPFPIKAAILLMAEHRYRNRGAVTAGRDAIQTAALAMGYESLLRPYLLGRC